jgi:hypothetical protein
VADVRELAREPPSEQALKTLVEIMSDQKAHNAPRVAAVKEILDRGSGGAPQSVTLKGEVEQHIINLLKGSGAPTEGRARPKTRARHSWPVTWKGGGREIGVPLRGGGTMPPLSSNRGSGKLLLANWKRSPSQCFQFLP